MPWAYKLLSQLVVSEFLRGLSLSSLEVEDDTGILIDLLVQPGHQHPVVEASLGHHAPARNQRDIVELADHAGML